jgi:hypothetical protein
MSGHVEAVATVGLLAIAAITPDYEIQLACMCGIGGALGGFIGAAQFPADTKKSLMLRWFINFALAIFSGPAITAWLVPKLPEIPVSYLAILAGGLIAMVGVGALIILYPRLQKVLKQLPITKNGSENERD